MKSTSLRNKMTLITVTIILTVPLFLSACSSSYERGDKLVAADEMKEGPGIFSGKKGAFYLVGGESKTTNPESLKKMNREETNRAIDDKLKQLDQDRHELEQLKEALNNQTKS